MIDGSILICKNQNLYDHFEIKHKIGTFKHFFVQFCLKVSFYFFKIWYFCKKEFSVWNWYKFGMFNSTQFDRLLQSLYVASLNSLVQRLFQSVCWKVVCSKVYLMMKWESSHINPRKC